MGLILLVDKIFVSPEHKVDELLKKKSKPPLVPRSEAIQKAYDNIKFVEEVRENPLLLKKEYKGFDAKVINLNTFLNLRLYPRSIYTTDKLLRLAVSSRYEKLKKHIAKKRAVSFNMLWIIIIIFAVIMVVIVFVFLLPQLGVI